MNDLISQEMVQANSINPVDGTDAEIRKEAVEADAPVVFVQEALPDQAYTELV